MLPRAFRPFMPMSALLLLSMAAPFAIGSGADASGQRIVAAFFDPTWSAERAFAAVAAAEGAVVQEGALRTILTAQGGANIKPSLYRHGAWLVIDVPFAGCGSRATRASS
jgi:hypothetical protein